MRLFLSDLHLESPDTSVFRTFADLMLRTSVTAESIHILGDLTEVWVGDDDDGELAVALTSVLEKAASRCRVTLIHGNRDFLFGDAFAERTGIELLPDPYLMDDGTLLAHGDAFCIEDEAYQ